GRGELFQDLSHPRVALADRVERGPVQLQDLAGAGGGDGGGAGPAGEGRDLAEEGPLAQQGQGHARVAGAAHEHLHAARGQDEDALAGLAFRDDDVSRLEGEELQALDEREQLLIAEILEQRVREQARTVGAQDGSIHGNGRGGRLTAATIVGRWLQLADAVAYEVHEPSVEAVVRHRTRPPSWRGNARGRRCLGRGRRGIGAQQGREVDHLHVAALDLLDLLQYGDGLVREAGAGELVGQADQDGNGVLLLARLEQHVGQAQAHARIPAALAEVRLQHLDGLPSRARVGQGDGAHRRHLRTA